MRRADRLFQIIQILRRSTPPMTASQMAEELEMSQRSVYRDIADLIGQRVPIRGEAGVGYVLDSDFDMPPLMLTPDELEAAVLGAQWVADKGDPVLAERGARPDRQDRHRGARAIAPLRRQPSVGTPLSRKHPPDGLDIAQARAWIRNGRKIRIRYRDETGARPSASSGRR